MKKIQKSYQAVIIGGGIVGAGIFRDLSLHNINCLLIDKKEFASQTSSKSSKMLHGGIRYLENLDFMLVHEALIEKNLWINIAPQFAKEKMFLMPVYKDSLRSLYEVWAGIYLYDFLSKFQNSSCKFYSKNDVINFLPQIKRQTLKGGGLYADAIVDDKALNLAVIKDAKMRRNANIKENCEIINFYPYQNGYIVELKENDNLINIFTNDLVIATGPFTDKFLSKISCLKWRNCLLPSKGSHLWIKRQDLNINHPVVLTPNDGRVIFVIPHDDKILVGTTEVKAEGDFFNLKPTCNEVRYLLNNLNEFFPLSNLNERHIQDMFSGIRPLVKEDISGSNQGKTSREHKIYNPYNNLHIIVGGKFTTFRVMGQQISKRIVIKNNKSFNKDMSKSKLIN